MVEMLLKKPANFKIDLNAKAGDGNTAFLIARENGHSKLAEMLIQKSAEFNIDLNAQELAGQLFILPVRMVTKR